MPKGKVTNPSGKNGGGHAGGHQPRVSADETRLMFEYYIQCSKNITKTAKAFNRSWKTVKKLAIVNNWNKKSDVIEIEHTKTVAKEIQKQSVSDLQIIQGAITKVAKALLSEDFKKDPSWSDLISLMRLKLELHGELPAGNQGTGNTYYNTIVNQFTDEQQQQVDRNLGAIFGRLGKKPSIRTAL